MPVASKDEARRIAEHAAWLEYLEEVRDLESGRYDEVERWAWHRLMARLRQLREGE